MKIVALPLIVLIAVCGCEQKSATTSHSNATEQNAETTALPASLFLTESPSDVADVKASKPSLQVGDAVTLRGRIGGSKQPFVAGRAVFTIVDKALPACSDNPDDHCASPWDYCCESRADILAHSATVQVVDESGEPLKVGLENTQGLKPLNDVIVVGKVAQRDEAGVLVVNASGLYVASR